MEVGAQEDTVDGERVERGEIEGQKELGVVETVEELEQQERTGEEDEAQKDRAESEKVERGEMDRQKELGVMGTEEMEADKEREQTEEAGKKEPEVKKKVVATSRKSAVKISAKKKKI
ncbi:hypothetical protein QQF64_034311 [Cirrhinus molitorella]|uniref:Uncharacterized protein n=1 Tax=Cirrhinus molitorella TaxID=172907 RepID=A0ABR3L1F4_9TELE